jgi:hypothetical protein
MKITNMNMIINTNIIRINKIKKLFSEQLSDEIYIKKNLKYYIKSKLEKK